jgi:uncharacterized protein
MNTNNIEKRFWEIETRAKKNAKGDIIGLSGNAAVAGSYSEDLGGFIEIIEDGAFERADTTDVIAKFNHEDNMVLGRTKTTNGKPTLDVFVGERSLSYNITELPDTQAGRDLKEHLKRGEIDKSSFAFSLFSKDDGDDFDGRVFEKRADGQWIGTIKRGGIKKVYDVSPVWSPAYPAATASPVAMRSLEKAKEEFRSTETEQPETKQEINTETETPVNEPVNETVETKEVETPVIEKKETKEPVAEVEQIQETKQENKEEKPVNIQDSEINEQEQVDKNEEAKAAILQKQKEAELDADIKEKELILLEIEI